MKRGDQGIIPTGNGRFNPLPVKMCFTKQPTWSVSRVVGAGGKNSLNTG